MSTNWLKLERALARAEQRLARRVDAHAWVIQLHNYRWHHYLKTGRKWPVSLLNSLDGPVWYDRTKLWLVYDDVWLLAVESETLVLRLRALKFHGSVAYIDPRYTKVPKVRDYDLHPDL